MKHELTRTALLLNTGESFVRDAYLYALDRPVDPDGLKSHLERLASGETTESILKNLEESPEGRRVRLRRSCLERIRG